MREYVLQTPANVADDILSGRRTFDIRENTQCFQKGDRIRFKPVEEHSIKSRTYEVSYVLSGYGLKNGFVCLGIKEVEKK